MRFLELLGWGVLGAGLGLIAGAAGGVVFNVTGLVPFEGGELGAFGAFVRAALVGSALGAAGLPLAVVVVDFLRNKSHKPRRHGVEP